jgi:DNA polymerase-3 subunit delta'
MDWNTFLGHHRQRQWFQNAISSERLASTFLMVGPEAVGKRTFARLIAKTLLCTRSEPRNFQPCGNCESCAQVEASTHPDLIQIHREHDRTALSIDQFIGPEEARMRQGLCYEIRMKPYSGRRKIAIIDDADTIGIEGANSLLKTLEEPPPGSVIFLISTSLQRQLPTIRSRCQVVRFQELSKEDLVTLALRQGLAKDAGQANHIAAASGGSLASFAILSDTLLNEFQAEMERQLMQHPFDFVRFAKAIQSHVDSVGSESQAKRERLKQLIEFTQQHFRLQLLERVSSKTLSPESSISAIRRCLLAKEHVDRMVSPAALIEAWSADLATFVHETGPI